MNGDLDLSGSLGGLRIANPDDEAASSPSPNATQSEFSSSQRIPAQLNVRQEQDDYGAANSALYTPTSPAQPAAYPQQLNHQRSLPLEERIQSQPRNASDPPQYHQTRGPTPQNPSRRPMSGIYQQHNGSSSSGLSQRDPSRWDAMPSYQQMGVSRSTSRSASNQLTGGMPSRSASQRERSSRQSQQFSVGSAVVPPRRNSRRIPGHQPNMSQSTQMSTSPYAIEGGPLHSSEEWKEKGAAVATRQEIGEDGRPISRVVKKGVKDFAFGRTLGEGSYSTVLAATDRQTGREYAIKVLDKRHIIKEKKVKYVNIEKDTLNRLTEHPGIVRLYYTFQDERSLYFVLDLAAGGELLGVLKRTGTFDEECTRFYSAQILDSIAYMHMRGVIHRDLKPENVLLDENMHTKITDFGTAKILNLGSNSGDGPGVGDSAGDPMDGAETDRAVSFVGTAEYVSPELLTDKNACKASDLWAFGCIVYQLLTGRPPFKASNEYQTFQKIVALDYHFPEGFPPIARDLIERLLVLDPAKRLPIEHIRTHPFFEGIKLGKGLWRAKAPRLKPYIPMAAEPIKLNNGGSAPAPNVPKVNTHTPSVSQQSSIRPQLRGVAALPPPSQLDIDWSPVLTRNNERILKLGNLIVTAAPAPHSPTSQSTSGATPPFETPPRKFSRFFGGATTKRKERLVMVTSTARIMVAAAGGAEKKTKVELVLTDSGVTCRSFQDLRGLTAFVVETRDKHYTFEDPRATTSDPEGSKYSTKEWMESIEWAKELAMSQSVANSYSGDSQYNDYGSNMPSPPGTGTDATEVPSAHHGRHTLRKDPDNESMRGRKNPFNKRQSKSGLAAVF